MSMRINGYAQSKKVGEEIDLEAASHREGTK